MFRKNVPPLTLITYVVLGIGILANIVLAGALISRPTESTLIGLIVTYVVLNIVINLPYIIAWYWNQIVQNKKSQSVSILVSSILMVMYAIWTYYEVLFVLPPDAQSALIFIAVPAYQIAGLMIIGILFSIVQKIMVSQPKVKA